MKNMLMLIAITAIRIALGDVLYWMVDDTATVDGQSICTFLTPYTVDEDNWNTARVRVSGGALTNPIYLDLYFGEGYVESGEYGVELMDNGSGYWGSGVPTGNQSPYGSEIAMESMFTMEIVRNSYDALTDTISYEVLAQSDSKALSQLSNYIYHEFDLNPPTTRIWTPTEFYTAVPEPDAGVLVLLGLGMIGLQRKKKGNNR